MKIEQSLDITCYADLDTFGSDPKIEYELQCFVSQFKLSSECTAIVKVGDEWMEFSNGGCQKISIARAFKLPAKILFYKLKSSSAPKDKAQL